LGKKLDNFFKTWLKKLCHNNLRQMVRQKTFCAKRPEFDFEKPKSKRGGEKFKEKRWLASFQ
jgi:hypothetical protein